MPALSESALEAGYLCGAVCRITIMKNEKKAVFIYETDRIRPTIISPSLTKKKKL